MLRNFKVLLIFMVVILIAGATYAFAAANIVPATKVGDGTGLVTGYTITAVEYTLNGTDPTKLDSVAFDLGADAATGKVKVQLVLSGTWYPCTHGLLYVWSCDTTTPSLLVASINQLRIVAASQ
jgi:hypothetical protein